MNKEKYYLIRTTYIYYDDYNNKLDIDGFNIITESKLIEINNGIEKAMYPKEVYFSVNKELIFKNSNDTKKGLIINELSIEEANIFKKYIKTEIGFIPDFASWNE